MDNATFRQIGDVIEKNSTIGIVTVENPTLDEMGSALALYLSLTKIGKTVSVSTPKEPLVEVSSLVGIDQVKTSMSGNSGDMIVSFPYEEGEIEKVSYTLENGQLNIVVKAGEKGLSFSEKDVTYSRPQGVPDVLFVIGVQRLSDLGKMLDVTSLKDTTVINIDNKADNQGFGDIVLVYPMLSSISEQVANLILALGLKIDIDISQNLIHGISFATNNFQNPKTSALAFEMTGVLMRNGAIRVNNKVREYEPEEAEKFFPKPSAVANKIQDVKQEVKEEKQDDNPPKDWLAPKIYKGSTNF